MTDTRDRELPPHTAAATAERGRRRREEIVAVATEMFAAEGYRGASLARIAARVGITQAALLHHFGSKERLLHAVVERRRQQDVALGDRILDAGSGLAALDRLPLLARHNEQRAGLVQLFKVLLSENLDEGRPLHDYFVNRYRDLRSRIAEALARGQAAGDVRPDLDPPAVAARIVATLEGLETQWLLDPAEVDLHASFTELAGALRVELAPRQGVPPWAGT